MASNLNIIEKKLDNSVLVELNGEVDIDTSDEFRKKLYEIVEKNEGNMNLDCTNLNYIDSTGLGVLVGVLKKVKSNGNDIYVSNLKSTIKKLFLITGLDKVFIIKE